MPKKKNKSVNTDLIAEINKYLICLGMFCSLLYTMILLNAAWFTKDAMPIDKSAFAIDKLKQFGGFYLSIFGMTIVLFILNKYFEKKKSLFVIGVTTIAIVTILYSIILSLSMVNISSLF